VISSLSCKANNFNVRVNKTNIRYSSTPDLISVWSGSLEDISNSDITFLFRINQAKFLSNFSISFTNLDLNVGDSYRIATPDFEDQESGLRNFIIIQKTRKGFVSSISSRGTSFIKGKFTVTKHDRNKKIIEGKLSYKVAMSKTNSKNALKSKRKMYRVRSNNLRIDYNDKGNVEEYFL
jgi:hypothetical protein